MNLFPIKLANKFGNKNFRTLKKYKYKEFYFS